MSNSICFALISAFSATVVQDHNKERSNKERQILSKKAKGIQIK